MYEVFQLPTIRNRMDVSAVAQIAVAPPPLQPCRMSAARSRLANLLMDVEHFVDLNAALSCELADRREQQKDLVKVVGIWSSPLPPNVMDRIMGFVATSQQGRHWNRYPEIYHADNDPVLPYHPMHFARGDFPEHFPIDAREEHARITVKTNAVAVMHTALRGQYDDLLRRVQLRRMIAVRVVASLGVGNA